MRKFTSSVVTVSLSLLLILHSTLTAFAGISFVAGQGVVLTGADGVVLTGADGVVLTGADGVVLTGADGVVLTGADGVVLTGADALTYTGADGVVLTGADGVVLTGADSAGIQSLDPELALLLNQLPDSSAVNVFVIFHRMPTESDLDGLRAVGITGGTIFRNLPMVMINATRSQVETISTMPSVRSIYSNKTIEFFTHDTRVIAGQSYVTTDVQLTRRNGGLPLSGQGSTVAVIDTGIDATHPDLPYGTCVIQNVRMADLQGSAQTFVYPQAVEGVADTDPAMGHGTFVAGIISGSGSASGGYYGGIAPGAQLLGVAVGDASLFFVLSGIDYVLSHRVDRNIRVVNCSFGISGLFDAHDPVNIATRAMHDSGISVIFSAGNRGSQPNSLNPYSVAPWVIGVGSGTKTGSLSTFSSRGAAAYGLYYPSLIAPGENVISDRATGINVVGTSGLAGALVSPEGDLNNIPPSYLSRYTMSSGTSFAAPHVAGTVALMLQANPNLTPDQIKSILQETATPMLGYSRYEVGAGHLNTYAAVQKAAFGTPYGAFRSSLGDSNLKLTREPITKFSGEVAPGGTYTTTFQVPEDAIFSTVQASWARQAGLMGNLSLSVSRNGQVVQSKPAALLAGQGAQKTGVTINEPASGEWSLTIRNTADSATSGIQKFVGAIETFRISYSNINGIAQLSANEQQAVKRAVRTGLVPLYSNSFAGDSPASRLELARALMLGAGAGIPQYLPYSPSFVDVPNDACAIFVESVSRSSRNLMGASGPYFNPGSAADRLTAAIAAVKALGLEQSAQSASANNPGLADWNEIPESARGYVAIALSRSLMSARDGGYFRPSNSMTRTELATLAVALQQASR